MKDLFSMEEEGADPNQEPFLLNSAQRSKVIRPLFAGGSETKEDEASMHGDLYRIQLLAPYGMCFITGQLGQQSHREKIKNICTCKILFCGVQYWTRVFKS